MNSKTVIASEEMTPVHLRAKRSVLAQKFGRTILRIMGWRVVGEIPSHERILIIGAPHTSNWDFVLAMAAILALNLKLRWLGKHTIFKPGVRWFMDWLGGIPVNRGQPESIVDNVARLVEQDKGIVIGLAPEGTRKKVDTWKTGFYYIAKKANVPILMFTLDFKNKVNKFSEPFYPTDDIEADFKFMRAFFDGVEGKIPEYS